MLKSQVIVCFKGYNSEGGIPDDEIDVVGQIAKANNIPIMMNTCTSRCRLRIDDVLNSTLVLMGPTKEVNDLIQALKINKKNLRETDRVFRVHGDMIEL